MILFYLESPDTCLPFQSTVSTIPIPMAQTSSGASKFHLCLRIYTSPISIHSLDWSYVSGVKKWDPVSSMFTDQPDDWPVLNTPSMNFRKLSGDDLTWLWRTLKLPGYIGSVHMPLVTCKLILRQRVIVATSSTRNDRMN